MSAPFGRRFTAFSNRRFRRVALVISGCAPRSTWYFTWWQSAYPRATMKLPLAAWLPLRYHAILVASICGTWPAFSW